MGDGLVRATLRLELICVDCRGIVVGSWLCEDLEPSAVPNSEVRETRSENAQIQRTSTDSILSCRRRHTVLVWEVAAD